MTPGRARAAAIPLWIAMAAGPLRAQVVTGRLVDADANRPIAHAFVQLLDSAGARHAGAVTDSAGTFMLEARAPGAYRVQAERLGYESVSSPVIRLGDAPLDYVFALSPRALVLQAVDARSEDDRGCARRPDGPAVYALWDAVRKALTVTSWTRETGALRFTMMNHVSELDPSLRMVRQDRTPVYATATIPYGAVDPDHLADYGYSVAQGDTTWLLGVDANVLLSESFLNSHCFRIAETRDTSLIGLGFEPLRRDDRADVRGVLWVSRRTSELQHLAFEYEGLPDYMRAFGAGGEVHFERLDNGIWIISRWWIRSPHVGRRRGSDRVVLLGYREDGGTVTSADRIDTNLYGVRGRGVIEGVVLDSVRDGPLRNALVYLSGTPFSALTDADGRYRMERVPNGSYPIGFTHPVLEELNVPLPLDTVTITGSEPVHWTFLAPSMRTILRTLCPGVDGPGDGLLYGIVRDQATGAAVAGVEVRASWDGPGADTGRFRRAQTTSDGRYFICRVPTNRELQLRLDTRRARHRSAAVRLSDEPMLRYDFE